MHRLAIDPSTNAAWALLLDGQVIPLCGSWDLGEGLTPGAYFLALGQFITGLRRHYGIDGEPLQIIIEDNSLNAVGSSTSKHLAESWVGVVELYAEAKKLPRPIAVPVNSWRSAFIGRSAAPKEIKEYAARKKWIKQAVMHECARRGLSVANDNEADAIGILFWFNNGGVVVQEQRRADKKARTAAKRAQKKLPLKQAA